MSASLRFGVWAPVDAGKSAKPGVPGQATYAQVRDFILRAESLGFESTLLALHTMKAGNPDVVEPWTAAAALAALTRKIELIPAIKARLYHPVVLAKLMLGIEEISEGRFGINFVNSFIKAEIEQAGLPFDEHDDRYAYGSEWLQIVRGLISGETVNFQGKYFHISDYTLRPISRQRDRPRIYSGGESEPGRTLAARFSDGWFLQGQPVEDIRALISDMERRLRDRAPMRYLLSSYVIARETDDEAEDVLRHRLKLQEASRAKMESFFRDPARVDQKAVVFQRMLQRGPILGTGGGTGSRLVGSYETVARRIQEFQDVGVTDLMLQFQPLDEIELVAGEVIPRVRSLELQAV